MSLSDVKRMRQRPKLLLQESYMLGEDAMFSAESNPSHVHIVNSGWAMNMHDLHCFDVMYLDGRLDIQKYYQSNNTVL